MKKIAIVDGFSSGKFIAKGLHDKGCELVHISSSSQLDDYYYNGFDYGIYSESIIHENMSKTIDFIKKFNAEYVIAGTESGVTLADKINNELLLPYRNSIEASSSRRNKYDMIETIRSAGLNAANQIKISMWEEALSWLQKGKYPVVLKPLESAGSDGVFICHNEEEVQLAFEQVAKKKNKLNLINEQVLLQEFLEGTEYVVNFVSLNGAFVVTEVVKYYKRKLESGNIVYDIDEIIDSTSDEFELLVKYTANVCACLGIKNGPSHAEVMLTKNGPCLVEIAARSDGILRPDVSSSSTGMGQLTATVLSITEPENFLMLSRQPFYKLKNFSFNVCLISPKTSVFNDVDIISLAKTLPSFKRIELYLSSGDNVSKTKDVFSQPGTIYLVSSNKSQLWDDYKVIRESEETGIYLN
ncbi:Dapdiamide A synthase [Dickeya dianthicola]|uniref:ATP-grasp domain-containing protein n=1 Tax=Dickeya dianthicola TaxID=204039 RepID=A0ABX9NRH6_9GAMM|nr:ATP-grasp domain-containing protein [Dickeya dianthicola]AYC17564.1 Dapdiamide A synthase [Dickeya dianthicola]MBI0437947.1 ATP-grasp domain-containing protein [Dickeya dianthicola]MBI0448150.1 ATP-grasp domain-containing protein [Dickeya dianthicola]MBI0452764.1 ATP-grasp domain-containing protein [Dickeya dianthicola]MBI0457255.1 ATP-grasp domain-containing protein [Dickeya dianthicola]